MAMQYHPNTPEGAELIRLFEDALVEIVEAIRVEMQAGRSPRGRTNLPDLRINPNGMPSMSDGRYWDNSGPLQFADLLTEASDRAAHRTAARFREFRFPSVDAFVAFVRECPEVSPAYDCRPALREGPLDFGRMVAESQLAHAANRFLQRYGDRRCDGALRISLLAPFRRGLFSARLEIAHVIPVALVRFDFDRARLADDVLIVRMSPGIQRARWAVKAYGASGHDAVLAAATHAFVLKGWDWPNAGLFEMSSNLAAHNPSLRREVEKLFAALRLATGVETGFAQEVRLQRHWTHFASEDTPEVNAAGARRYPEHFDDFGWNSENLPTIRRSEASHVRHVLTALRTIRHERMELALRRLNSAMIRSDPADAILDATIALEILLADGDGQSISYKLKMRAAAISRLIPGDPDRPLRVSETIGRIYDARSRIVHGGRRQKALPEDRRRVDDEDRRVAIDALRHLTTLLLDHPRYLDPKVIDRELLMGAT